MNSAAQHTIAADFTRPIPEGKPGAQLRIVHADPRYGRVILIEPTTLGYLYIAATVRNSRASLVLPNANRRELLVELKEYAREIERLRGVVNVAVFRAIFMPPTARFSSYLKDRGSRVKRANFDVIVLIQASSPAAARDVQMSPAYGFMLAAIRKASRPVHVIAARNARRIGDVATDKGLFLFNHFVAEDVSVMLPLWEYLAGWYVAETGLTNSIALVPEEGGKSDYAIINWARWDVSPLRHFWTQLTKPSFWRTVPRNLDANCAASMPIYCRLA